MTGLKNMGFDLFDEAEAWLRARGVDEVVNPAQLDRDAGFDPTTMEATQDVVNAAINRDIDALKTCKSIVLLDGWRDSTGACAEHGLAKWLGLDLHEMSALKNESQMPIDVGTEVDNDCRWAAVAEKMDSKLDGLIMEAPESPPKHYHTVDELNAAWDYAAGLNAPSDKDIKESNPKDRVGSMKVPLDLVPAHVMMETSLAMLEGSLEYGSYNFRDIGIRASIYYSAHMRHMMAWWEGEDIDPKSGFHHIIKAIACLVILRDATVMDKCDDDRPPAIPSGWVERFNAQAKSLIEKYEADH